MTTTNHEHSDRNASPANLAKYEEEKRQELY
jgi:hypothetical protein